LSLAVDAFASQTQTIMVTNGKITVDNTGALDRMTKINFIEITATGTQPTQPATPTNLAAVGSSAGIQLDWDDSTDPSVVGYDVYRSADGSANWTKLDTSGALTASQYLDTTAAPGTTSFYQVVAINGSNVASAPATASALRPAVVSNAIKINFTLDGSPLVAGYDADSGDVFGLRADGLTYGWNKSHTSDDRDRNKNANQLLDTLVQMQSNSNWSINVANGTYTVKVSVGDSQYTSANTLNVNGTNYWTNLALGVNQFATMTQTIVVTNGKIVLDNTGAADRMTKLNYIEITPV